MENIGLKYNITNMQKIKAYNSEDLSLFWIIQ